MGGKENLERLKCIYAKLELEDVQFLQRVYGTPFHDGTFSIDRIKVCYWSADDVRSYFTDNEMEPPSEEDIAEILHMVESRFDAGIGMNWDIFNDVCAEYVLDNK